MSLIALLLDLSNIIGGFLLAIPLLTLIPNVGDALARADRSIAPYAWIVGVIALICGGYFLIVHLTDGPNVFQFELVGIGVGVALLWERLTGRSSARAGRAGVSDSQPPPPGRSLEGWTLILAIFGIIAIIVGIQGLFTPDG